MRLKKYFSYLLGGYKLIILGHI